MKYQSELIKEILEDRGHEKSSLHYESECIESWIEENKGSYPKLCDYQTEWLNYINENIGIGDFPYVTLTDVTDATINNTVPFAYKSAILKGCTLVNLVTTDTSNGYTLINDGTTTKSKQLKLIDGFDNKIYTFILELSDVNIIDTNGAWVVYITTSSLDDKGSDNTTIKSYIKNGKIAFNYKPSRQKKTVNNFYISLHVDSGVGSSITISNVVVLDGDYTNVDIPYFTGMKSVQMPVLTTSNEDGTKTNILTTNEEVELRGVGDVKDELDCLTGQVTERIGEIILDDTLSYEHAWGGGFDTETDYIIGVKVNNHLWNVNNEKGGSLIKCDNLRTRGITSFNGYGYLLFYVSKSVLGEELTNAKIREYILSLNATVQYPLATESIKTLALLVQDQNGNIINKIKPIEGTMYLSTSSDTIKPLFSGEIPVEATTQNLASFIDLEMEE